MSWFQVLGSLGVILAPYLYAETREQVRFNEDKSFYVRLALCAILLISKLGLYDYFYYVGLAMLGMWMFYICLRGGDLDPHTMVNVRRHFMYTGLTFFTLGVTAKIVDLIAPN